MHSVKFKFRPLVFVPSGRKDNVVSPPPIEGIKYLSQIYSHNWNNSYKIDNIQYYLSIPQ